MAAERVGGEVDGGLVGEVDVLARVHRPDTPVGRAGELRELRLDPSKPELAG